MSTIQTPYAFTMESNKIFDAGGYALQIRVDSTVTMKLSNQHGDRGNTHAAIVDIDVHEITDMNSREDITADGLQSLELMAEIREYIERRESYLAEKVG